MPFRSSFPAHVRIIIKLSSKSSIRDQTQFPKFASQEAIDYLIDLGMERAQAEVLNRLTCLTEQSSLL